MKYIDEYRDRELILSIADKVKSVSKKEITVMEVCGGHTMAIHRFGLPALLPSNIRLVSGPGCPVCVSGLQFIDRLLAYCRLPGVTIATYGDLIRVPGSASSLEKERACGSDIRIVYSVLEALEAARLNRGRKIVFPGIGFETTAPSTAAAVIKAKEEGITNFFILSAHKIMPPVMEALTEGDLNIDGFIAPGHVTAITGASIYTGLVEDHGLGVIVSGFEPADIMQSVLMLVMQAESGIPAVEIQYSRVAGFEGNKIAMKLMNEVFGFRDENWRGLGVIPLSGLQLREEYSSFDAERQFGIEVPEAAEPEECICGQILRGIKRPPECPLFADRCNPADPVGACMVSAEGTCAAYYKYRS